MKSKYLKLFTSCLFLSSFTFGGGYVIVPLMKKKFVEDLKWLDEDEVLDMTAIAQSSPGAIAINTALLLGYRVGGFLGALIALLGMILPSLVIVSTVSFFYSFVRDNTVIAAVLKGMQAGVAALICDVSVKLTSEVAKTKSILRILAMLTAFVLIFFLNINVAYIVIACLLAGILAAIFEAKAKRTKPSKAVQATGIDSGTLDFADDDILDSGEVEANIFDSDSDADATEEIVE